MESVPKPGTAQSFSLSLSLALAKLASALPEMYSEEVNLNHFTSKLRRHFRSTHCIKEVVKYIANDCQVAWRRGNLISKTRF